MGTDDGRGKKDRGFMRGREGEKQLQKRERREKRFGSYWTGKIFPMAPMKPLFGTDSRRRVP